MKYLKLYESFIINNISLDDIDDEVEKTLREICLELEDIGARIYITNSAHQNKINVGFIEKIPWYIIRECALRIKEYLGVDYISFYYQNNKNAINTPVTPALGWKQIELDDYTNIELFGFAIFYKTK